MRIRSIRPEFWSSEDIAAMDWHTRLVYIGLWSYVDDNGVGRDVEKLIVTSLFPLDDNLSEASVRVHGALKHLETAGNITRYMVGGKPYLHISAWNDHQKINRPSGSRYPLPTREDAVIHDPLTEPSLSPHANAPLGEGEKGRRGEEEKTPSSKLDDAFDTFWSAYPKRVGKGQAVKAWRAAVKKSESTAIVEAAEAYAAAMSGTDPRFIAHPATWLNGERWADEAAAPPTYEPVASCEPTPAPPVESLPWLK